MLVGFKSHLTKGQSFSHGFTRMKHGRKGFRFQKSDENQCSSVAKSFLSFDRSPKIAVPTRTSVAPSSMPIGKSSSFPSKAAADSRGILFAERISQFAKLNKIFPRASASSASGGIHISPTMDNRGSASSASICSRNLSGRNPNLLPSPATLTSSKTRGCNPSSSAIRLMSCASARESTL